MVEASGEPSTACLAGVPGMTALRGAVFDHVGGTANVVG
jgi:hypothetical protein